MDSRYEVRLVIEKDLETMLDMTIGCENAQQLDKARKLIDERLIDSTAMFAMEQALTARKAANPAPADEPEKNGLEKPKTEFFTSTIGSSTVKSQGNTAATKSVRAGTKGLMALRCPGCGDTFGTFLKELRNTTSCGKCGKEIPIDYLAKYEYTCPKCGKHSYGQTNIEDATLDVKCFCGKWATLEWSATDKEYLLRTK